MTPIAFLIDMDGVIYRESELIPGAKDFIDLLLVRNIPFTFVTNNSQRSRRDIMHKLHRMGIEVSEKHIFTCAMATARFLSRQKLKKTAYVIGEGGLLNALHQNGFAFDDVNPDYVIVGEGKSFTMNMVEHAANLILKGAKLIATNMDPNCPTEKGTRPGCGATTSMLELTTGKTAFSVGKPSPIILAEAIKDMGALGCDIHMVGDTMSTDILGAVQSQIKSILVLSGGTKIEDIDQFSYAPTYILDSVADIISIPEMSLECLKRERPSVKKRRTSEVPEEGQSKAVQSA